MKYTPLASLLLACLTGLASALHASTTLTIQDGVRIHPPRPALPEGFLYWGTADTTLDHAWQDGDFGGSYVLRLQPSRARVLLKFEQLLPCIGGPFCDVKKAELKLHFAVAPARLPHASDIRVYRVRLGWNEGGLDGATNYWAATWNSRYHSDRGNAIPWQAPGAAGGKDATFVKDAAVSFDADKKTMTISGLEKSVSTFLEKQYENFGWLVTWEQRASGRTPGTKTLSFHSREAVVPAKRPSLSLIYEPVTPPNYPIDLGVAYIERHPEYYAWLDVGSYEMKKFRGVDVGILKAPEFADVPKNPAPGDMLQYAAVIKNHGKEPVNGFAFRWRVNDVTKKTGTVSRTLGPEQEWRIYFSYPCPGNWTDHRDEFITLRVEPVEKKSENKNNNELTIFTKARAAGIHVDETSRQFYRTYYSAYGTYSFEDWIQFQIQYWNQIYFPKSRIRNLFPDGALPRVRIQRISYFRDGTLQGPVHIAFDCRDPLCDGMWGWDLSNLKPEELKSPDCFFRRTLRMCEPSLMHEMSHQCFGLIDIYWMTMEAAKNADTGEGGKVKLRDPRNPDKYLTGVGYWPAAGGLMGGGDTRYTPDHEPTTLYSDHSVYGLNVNAPWRGGFFGDYTYGLQTNVTLHVTNENGKPAAGAEITAWQSTYWTGEGIIDNSKTVFEGVLDNNGNLTLPNQTILEDKPFTTLTGHTLRPNPFGRIHVCGFNGSILIQAKYKGVYYYRMLEAWELNVAFAEGHRDSYVYDWQLDPDSRIDTFKVAR